MAEEITKKQFLYKGRTVEELQKLNVREFAELAGSQNKRNILRNFQKIEDFINRAKVKIKKGKAIRTHSRDLIIMPEMVGWKILVYNGNNFMPVQVIGEMLGHKFGEFAMTRQKTKHSKAGVGATKGTKSQSKK